MRLAELYMYVFVCLAVIFLQFSYNMGMKHFYETKE